MTHEDAEHACGGGGEAVARPAIFGREELGRDGVEHPVHDLSDD